jgi:hypothetical protein
MPTAENARLDYEAGQQAYPMEALTDSGDAITFTSNATLFSEKSGYSPVVLPDGLVTGGEIIPAVSGSNDVVDTAALTLYLVGVLTSVSADTDVSITRPATTVAKINSITVTALGAIAMVAGTDSSDTTMNEVRGSAGGPPLIDVGAIEIGQVRVVTDTAGPITAAQIFTVTGLHRERYDYPLWEQNNGVAKVEFYSALQLFHTGPVAKTVYASYADPIFAQISLASEFVPPETSHSVTSTPVYGATLGASSSSLNQGSFTAYLQDGVTDPMVKLKNETLWFKFWPDKYKTPYVLAQGKLGISRTFPAGDNIAAACTVSASSEALNNAS